MIRHRIEAARPEDMGQILELLREHQLPPDGLRNHLPTTLVAREDRRIIGTAALELYADGALLRSVAVRSQEQGRGLGHELTDAAVRLAQEAGAGVIYLLTTTADRFFPKFGFERIERREVPASVQASVEFSSACPSTATVMRKAL
jgi:amino-acid N-acetyltransferase